MRLYELNYSDYRRCASEAMVQWKRISCVSLGLEGEQISLKTRLQRLAFLLLSRGRFWIYYVKDSATGAVIHTSYVMGYGAKFPFMQKKDIHIGPCRTSPGFRGKGIYKSVLRVIHNENCDSFEKAYMIVAESNIPSIKGIEAAGLKRVGTVQCSKFLKIYRRISDG